VPRLTVVPPIAASIFGLSEWPERLVLCAIAIVAAVLALWLLRLLLKRLAGSIPESADPIRRRQRQTAMALLATTLRYAVLIAAIVAIVVILAGGSGVAAIGGSAVVAIILGFASQRLLADVIAGFFILFEGQYAVGDIVELQPSAMRGRVEEVGIRTTVLVDAAGDRCFVPNGQITAVRRIPGDRRTLELTLVSRDPDEALAAMRSAWGLAGVDPLTATTEPPRDLGGGVVAVRAVVDVPATREQQARKLLAAALHARDGSLAAEPVISTRDPAAARA